MDSIAIGEHDDTRKGIEDVKEAVPQRIVLLIIAGIYLAWLYANLAANGMFALEAIRGSIYRRIGSVVYGLGVSISGIALPQIAARRLGISTTFRTSVGNDAWRAIISVVVLLPFSVVIGLAAMADQGVSFSVLVANAPSLHYLVSPIPTLIPTMIAYSILWHWFVFGSLRQVLLANLPGRYRVAATGAAILVTAFLYGLYHFTSIDEITTMSAIVDEVVITFAIRCVLLASVVFSRRLWPAFFADLVMNYFVFTPMNHFHPHWSIWAINIVIACATMVILHRTVGVPRRKNHLT